MAGDWLKVEETTPEKPEILVMSGLLGLDPEIVFTKCFKLWRWASNSSVDGVIENVQPDLLDSLFHCPGFSQALLKVGWLQIRSGSLIIPRFDRHLGQSSKRRALTAKRVAKSKKQKGNADGNAKVTLNALPKEEKRREEKKGKKKPNPLPLPPSLDTEEFRCAWADWHQYRKERRNSLTPSTEKEQLAYLEQLGPFQAIQSIRRSIRQGWQGLFEPEERNGFHKPQAPDLFAGHREFLARGDPDHEQN